MMAKKQATKRKEEKTLARILLTFIRMQIKSFNKKPQLFVFMS